MNVSELGDMWVAEFLKNLTKRRNEIVRQEKACKPGGDYGKQFKKIEAAYTKAIDALLQDAEVSAQSRQSDHQLHSDVVAAKGK